MWARRSRVKPGMGLRVLRALGRAVEAESEGHAHPEAEVSSTGQSGGSEV